jgi:hypothetical protein
MDARDEAAPLKADEHGWAEGRIEPLPIDRAWSLFSPEPACRIDLERWAHHAQRFFALRIGVTPKKAYPSGGSPLMDAFDFEVTGPRGDDDVERARVITVPLDRAPQARAAALTIARGPTGGGFEALILRAKRLWQIAVVGETPRDARPVLAAATVLASVLLAPILPPGEPVLFGVKTARERLERLARGA